MERSLKPSGKGKGGRKRVLCLHSAVQRIRGKGTEQLARMGGWAKDWPQAKKFSTLLIAAMLTICVLTSPLGIGATSTSPTTLSPETTSPSSHSSSAANAIGPRKGEWNGLALTACGDTKLSFHPLLRGARHLLVCLKSSWSCFALPPSEGGHWMDAAQTPRICC